MLLEVQQIEVDEWAIFCGDWQLSGPFPSREAAEREMRAVIVEANRYGAF